MTGPQLSIVVVVHAMPLQAENTIFSFSPGYQLGVTENDYEIVVVENRSADMLGEDRATGPGSNIRYFEYDNTSESPVASVAFGVAQSDSRFIGLVIDGARMVTPRVVQYALAGFRVTENAMVTVPGYHLGVDEQHRDPAHDQDVERAMLESIDWHSDGYQLFSRAVLFRGRHQPGYLRAMLESNALFCSRANYTRVGGIDLRFDLPGGGMANLDLYRRIGDLSDTRLFVLPGEGTFHQFHGGTTTRSDPDREKVMDDFKAQYLELRGEPYRSVQKRPTILGAVTGWALPTLRDSADAELNYEGEST